MGCDARLVVFPAAQENLRHAQAGDASRSAECRAVDEGHEEVVLRLWIRDVEVCSVSERPTVSTQA